MDNPTIGRDRTYKFKPTQLDVHMHVVRILWAYPDGFKLDIVWVNRFSTEIMHEDRVFLKRSDLHKWEQIHV